MTNADEPQPARRDLDYGRRGLDRTRDSLLAAAIAEHDARSCVCDRKYVMSCPRLAAIILEMTKE